MYGKFENREIREENSKNSGEKFRKFEKKNYENSGKKFPKYTKICKMK